MPFSYSWRDDDYGDELMITDDDQLSNKQQKLAALHLLQSIEYLIVHKN